MKKWILPVLVLGTVFLTGCAATQSVSIGGEYSIPAGKTVTASSSHLNFFLLSPTSPEAVEGILQDLAKQCGGKKVTGITTHYAPRSWLILPVATETITATGHCAE